LPFSSTKIINKKPYLIPRRDPSKFRLLCDTEVYCTVLANTLMIEVGDRLLVINSEQLCRYVINLEGSGPEANNNNDTTICYLSPFFNPPFFPSLSWTPQGVWAETAHPLPNILMQSVNSNV